MTAPTESFSVISGADAMDAFTYPSEGDWFGLYPADASADAILFPKVRPTSANTQASLFEVEAEQVTDSTTHPAKMSLPLLRRILAQMQEWHWLAPGSCVVDPFGGRGSTAAVWTAQDPRNRAVTVELEPHFVAMQQQVKAAAEKRLRRPLAWTILQGDSRRVDELLREAGVGITSPLYSGDDRKDRSTDTRDARILEQNATRKNPLGQGCWRGDYGFTEGQIGQLPDPATAILSPPYGQGTIGKCDAARLQALTQDPSSSLYGRNPNGSFFQAHAAGYVNSEGNIDNLPDESVSILSPPYEGSLASDDPDKRGGLFRDPKRRNDRTLNSGYSAVTSPPYEAQTGGARACEEGPLSNALIHRHAASNGSGSNGTGYAENQAGQIGQTQGETYGSACREVYSALARTGVRYLAVVTKNPTRGGKLRRLDHLTVRLLRQAGYHVVSWRRAWLFMSEAEVNALHGQAALEIETNASRRVKGRLSFFKRLSVAKGSPAAQWEDVFFCELVDGGEGVSVTSPPYMDSVNDRNGIDVSKCVKAGRTSQARMKGYETSPIGITSPAYEDTQLTGQRNFRSRKSPNGHAAANPREGYGSSRAESVVLEPPPSPWLTPYTAHTADPQPGARITFQGQDGEALTGTVTARRGAYFACTVALGRMAIPYEFDGQWPAQLSLTEVAL